MVRNRTTANPAHPISAHSTTNTTTSTYRGIKTVKHSTIFDHVILARIMERYQALEETILTLFHPVVHGCFQFADVTIDYEVTESSVTMTLSGLNMQSNNR